MEWGDAKDLLKEDVEGLGSVEDLGKIEAFILELKAKEDEKSDADEPCEAAKPSKEPS